MPAKTGQVEFGAMVPAAVYEEFRTNFPAYGAVKWFINEALDTFNQKVRENPNFKKIVNDAIEEMMRSAA